MKNKFPKVWEASGNYHKEMNPNVDQAYKNVRSKIQQTETSGGRQVSFFSYLPRIAAAVALLLGAYYFFLSENSNVIIQQTAQNQKETINLPDGTIAYLNENSVVEFPDNFPKGERKIKLEGEAFFDVSENDEKPFIIETKNFDIKVVGTSFNVRLDSKNGFEEVEVKSGKVIVLDKINKKKFSLTANDRFQFNPSNQKSIKNQANNIAGWQTNSLNFEHQPLNEIFQEIEELFDVQIKVENKSLTSCTYKTSLKETQDINEVLNIIVGGFNASVVQKSENEFVIKGGGC